MQFDLVHGRDDGGVWGGEQAVEVADGEVGDADVSDFAGAEEGLHGVPGLEEVPVGQVFLFVGGVGGGGPVLFGGKKRVLLFSGNKYFMCISVVTVGPPPLPPVFFCNV